MKYNKVVRVVVDDRPGRSRSEGWSSRGRRSRWLAEVDWRWWRAGVPGGGAGTASVRPITIM